MTKEARIYNGEKTISAICGVSNTEQLHVKECNYNTYTMYKNKLKKG